MQLGLIFSYKSKLTWQRSFLRLKGLFDEVDCQADKPHNGHPRQMATIISSGGSCLSQYTETFRGRKILNNIPADFSKIPAETEQQQRVGVICQNSGALAGALEDYWCFTDGSLSSLVHLKN